MIKFFLHCVVLSTEKCFARYTHRMSIFRHICCPGVTTCDLALEVKIFYPEPQSTRLVAQQRQVICQKLLSLREGKEREL